MTRCHLWREGVEGGRDERPGLYRWKWRITQPCCLGCGRNPTRPVLAKPESVNLTHPCTHYFIYQLEVIHRWVHAGYVSIACDWQVPYPASLFDKCLTLGLLRLWLMFGQCWVHICKCSTLFTFAFGRPRFWESRSMSDFPLLAFRWMLGCPIST